MTAEISLRIEATPLFAKTTEYGDFIHKQLVFKCSNNYGLSVVQGNIGIYCSGIGGDTYEVALIHWNDGAEDGDFEVVYAEGTPFGHDVQGWQTEADIAALLLVASRVTDHTRSIPRFDDEDEDL